MVNFLNVKKKILFINYSGYWMSGNSFIPDASLALLASILKKRGFKVELFDFQSPSFISQVMEYQNMDEAQRVWDHLKTCTPLPRELALGYLKQRDLGIKKIEEQGLTSIIAKIEKEKIKIVGFKLWTGNAFRGNIEIAGELKKRFKGIKLIAGGPAVRYMNSYIYDITKVFDRLVFDEAEDAIIDLLEEKKAPIANTSFFDSVTQKAVSEDKVSIPDLNSLPFPNYKNLFADIDSYYKMRIIDDSRGCFNKCNFCSHPVFGGYLVRKKSPKRVVDQIERYYREDHINYFRFSGSNPPWEFVKEIAREIIRRKLRINYSIFSSMNNIDSKGLGLVAASGLKAVQIGVESGDQKLLKEVHNKDNLGADHIVKLSHEIMNNGIFLNLSIIVPAPFETNQSKETTYNLLKAIFQNHKLGSVAVFPPVVAPGSLWWQDMKRFGIDFAPNYDDKQYVKELLETDWNFLLPRDCIKEIGLIINGRPYNKINEECQDFINRINQLKITTNIDDTSYMLGLMGGLNAHQYKEIILEKLIKGRRKRLLAFIEDINLGKFRDITLAG